jgi:excisionase family DNA binding protein
MASTSKQPHRYGSIERAAEIADVSPKTIRRRIADGSITGYRFGPRIIRVDLHEVESLFRPMPTATTWGR